MAEAEVSQNRDNLADHDHSEVGCSSHPTNAPTASQATDSMPAEETPDSSSMNTGPTDDQTASTEGAMICVHVPPIEYMLGIADLTGELMRMAIHSVGMGDLTFTFDLCKVIKVIYDAFVTFGNISRELPRKLSVLKQSLRKVETACYTLQIRGSEIPKHMLADVFSCTGEGGFEDEGHGN